MDALLLRCLALVALLSAGAPPDPAQSPAARARETGYVDPSVAAAVSRARREALRKLGDPGCRRVFAEFTSREGLPLDEVLASRGDTAESLIRRMAFLNGAGILPCGRRDVYAFTKPGSMSVFLCDRFRRLTRTSPASAANLLIHEMLHSLGAGEAPAPGFPTAYEITDQIESRCGE